MVDYSNHYMSDIVDCIIQVRVIFLLMKILSVKWRIKNITTIFLVNFPMGKNPFNLVISIHAYTYHDFFNILIMVVCPDN